MSAIRLSRVLSGAAAALLPSLLVSNCGTEVPTSPAVPTIQTAAAGGPGVTVRSTVKRLRSSRTAASRPW